MRKAIGYSSAKLCSIATGKCGDTSPLNIRERASLITIPSFRAPRGPLNVRPARIVRRRLARGSADPTTGDPGPARCGDFALYRCRLSRGPNRPPLAVLDL